MPDQNELRDASRLAMTNDPDDVHSGHGSAGSGPPRAWVTRHDDGPEPHDGRSRPMPTTMMSRTDELIYLGLDVSRDSIAVGTLRPGNEVPEVDKVFNDEPSVRRLIERFEDPRHLVACYEAGPTGYDLARLLRGIRISPRADLGITVADISAKPQVSRWIS